MHNQEFTDNNDFILLKNSFKDVTVEIELTKFTAILETEINQMNLHLNACEASERVSNECLQKLRAAVNNLVNPTYPQQMWNSVVENDGQGRFYFEFCFSSLTNQNNDENKNDDDNRNYNEFENDDNNNDDNNCDDDDCGSLSEDSIVIVSHTQYGVQKKKEEQMQFKTGWFVIAKSGFDKIVLKL